MREKSLWVWRVVILVIFSCSLRTNLFAQPVQSIFYTLIEGSQLVDDCPVCDRLAIVRPLRGTFELRFLQQGPLFDTFALDNISFVGPASNPPVYTVKGKGTYRVGGEVASLQDLYLEVTVDNGSSSNLCKFTNTLSL